MAPCFMMPSCNMNLGSEQRGTAEVPLFISHHLLQRVLLSNLLLQYQWSCNYSKQTIDLG